MNIALEPGKYVVAVSGGIDSVALLHMLRAQPGLELIVGHFNHGIRPDADDDRRFVEGLAHSYGLPFISEAVVLGPKASEETARTHRYAFLRAVREQANATAIVTAHQQDDVIETALLNVMRGTKRRGFVSLQSTSDIQRPLLHMTKQAIRDYALEHNLEWSEDSTNQAMDYLRNRIRGRLHQSLTAQKRQQIMDLLQTISVQNAEIDVLVNEILMKNETRLEKSKIDIADSEVAAEIMAGWLRRNQTNFDKKTITRLVNGAKKLRNGAKVDIDKQYYCLLTKHEIVLTPR
ncbi:MAG: tRNA lysidine(34) synthetase TilS [Candidatus Saccharimonadales bacterium]